MNSRIRFRETMRYGSPDRVPYFEEGIRRNVLRVWRSQGLARDTDVKQVFWSDPREEIWLDLEPRPKLSQWPRTTEDLGELEKRLRSNIRRQLIWKAQVLLKRIKNRDAILMLRIHRGFFLSMGVYDWRRFETVIRLLIQDPAYVKKVMKIQGEFAATVAEHILSKIKIDAVIFSEPIGGNDRPLISPKMYEKFVLSSYQPVFDVLNRYNVDVKILRTYSNARLLIPSMLKYGINCLWACEVNTDAMDYRSLRNEFGRDLRLIGGIDLDALRRHSTAIDKEIDKIAGLIKDGGYIPLADGRVREDVPYKNYMYYRSRLKELITS